MNYNKCNELLFGLRKKSEDYLIAALSAEKNTKEQNHLTNQVCSGCGACKGVCPKGAIKVEENESGFYHYKIDSGLCINCGECKKVCPVLNSPVTEISEAQKLFALKHNDNSVLLKSSSGGAAHAISSKLLKDSYVVCGCCYDPEDRRARHIIIDNAGDLHKLQGSKYIQSDTAECFEKLLQLNSKFAFIGTPCQVSGLDLLLRKKGKREDAILIDLICHGVPSLHFWDKYLAEKNEKHNLGEAVNCVFRDKTYSWHEKVITLSSAENTNIYSQKEEKDNYYAFFTKPIAYIKAKSFRLPERFSNSQGTINHKKLIFC